MDAFHLTRIEKKSYLIQIVYVQFIVVQDNIFVDFRFLFLDAWCSDISVELLDSVLKFKVGKTQNNVESYFITLLDNLHFGQSL